MNRSVFRSALFAVVALLGGVAFIRPAAAATCAISADTTIDSAYVESNSCDVIAVTGTPIITWSGTIDTGRAVTVNVNSGTATFSGALTLGSGGSSVTIANGATVTHATSDTGGVGVTAPTVTIAGSINANSKGCVGNSSGVAFGPNLSTGVCASGTSGYGQNDRGGAAYGGIGGASVYGILGGTTYGSSTNPSLLGSGGGGIGSSQVGGTGGGYVRLVVSGTLTINGSVSANGGNGVASYGGGGSGGSIFINAGTLAGSGTVTSNGGIAGNEAGGGGGGRVAVFYGSMTTFDIGSITAVGGIRTGAVGGAGSGGNGSTFILDRTTDDGAGNLRITSGLNFASDGDYSRTSVVVSSGAQLTCDSLSNLTIQGATVNLNGASITCTSALTNLVVSSTGILWMSGVSASFTGSVSNALFLGAQGINSTSSIFTLSNTQQVTFAATSSWQNTSSTLNVTKPGSQTEFQVPLTATFTNFSFTTAGPVSSGTSNLLLPANLSLTLVSSTLLANVSSTFTNLSVDASSSIRADGLGCAPASIGTLASGPNASTGVCATSTSGYGPNDRAGAGYGGAGGQSVYGVAGGVTYGSSTNPNLLGSGGGTASGQSAGGTGGGRIRLIVNGILTLNGTIRANGGNAVNTTYGGGGSGGSVYIYAGTLAGTGMVLTNGGTAGNEGGGGGGGRIALLYSQLSSFDLSTTSVTSTGGFRAGSLSAGQGSVGSIYTVQVNSSPITPFSLGLSTLVDGSTTSSNTPTFRFIVSDPDVGDTVQYQIQIDNSADFLSPVVDYTSALGAQGARLFTVGQASGGGSYLVGSSGQSLADGPYYWRVRAIDAALAESAYATANGGAIAFRVDAAVRTVQFYQSSASAIESVTATSIIITLDTTHFEDVQVHYAVTGGSADGSGDDYTLASGTATISAGETTTTVPLTIIDDLIAESDETIEVTLTSPVFAALGAKPSYTYTILDNDTAGVTISKSVLSASEDGMGGSYGVVLQSQPTTTVQILLSSSITQLQLSTSTITFSPANWNVSVAVNVAAIDDTRVDGTHLGIITHTASSTGLGYTSALDIGSVTVTIADNDTVSASGGGAVGVALPIPLPNMILIPLPPPVPEPVPVTSSPVSTEPFPVTPSVPPSPVADSIKALLATDAKSFGVTLTSEEKERIGIFIEQGSSPETKALGSGERRAIFRDMVQVQGKAPTSVDLERVATGQIPVGRSITRERELQPRALTTFKTIFGHAPNFKNEQENLAWNTLMYRIRFPRNLTQEKEGIQEFKTLFRKAPTDPFQWATVRVLGYIQK